MPRNFYFVRVAQDGIDAGQPGWAERDLVVETDPDQDREAKAPWKGQHLRRRVSGRYLFRTALARHVVPFGLLPPALVLLPLRLHDAADQQRHLVLLNSQTLYDEGERDTALWFRESERLWDALKTENNATMSASKYLNFQQKLTKQDLRPRYLVLYTASAQDANAVVLNREWLDLPFIADAKTYHFGTNDEDEAYFVCGFLNASSPNLRMKAFQSQGLFGEGRDVHKKILDAPFQQFRADDATHQALAAAGRAAAAAVQAAFGGPGPLLTRVPAGVSIGRLRPLAKAAAAEALATVDRLVAEIMAR